MVTQENRVYSLYGQGEFDLIPRLTATVGLRGTWERKQGVNVTSMGDGSLLPSNVFIGFDNIRLTTAAATQRCPVSAPLFICKNPPEQLAQITRQWGARYALDYQLRRDILVYVSASRGFKAGGFSVAALQGILGLSGKPVAPEIMWAYEGGVKSAWFDNSLQLNGALFYYDWEGLQSFQTLLQGGVAIPQLLNVPESHLLGAEAEIQSGCRRGTGFCS